MVSCRIETAISSPSYRVSPGLRDKDTLKGVKTSAQGVGATVSVTGGFLSSACETSSKALEEIHSHEDFSCCASAIFSLLVNK